MYSVKDSGLLIHWVAPFGYPRVKAFFQLTEAFRRFRVLHRLLIPRHPPAALNSLTKKNLIQAELINKHAKRVYLIMSYLITIDKSFDLSFRHFIQYVCSNCSLTRTVLKKNPKASIFISESVNL